MQEHRGGLKAVIAHASDRETRLQSRHKRSKDRSIEAQQSNRTMGNIYDRNNPQVFKVSSRPVQKVGIFSMDEW